jgi:hypothetical protein
MVFQSPPSLLVLIIFSATVFMSIIALGITGGLCNYWNYCAYAGTVAAGPAIGIVAAIFGGLLSGLGITWLILTPLWNFQPMKYILMAGYSFVTLFAFISGVILAWTAHNELVGGSYATCGAGSAFEFFLMLSAAACIFFVIRVSGGLSGSRDSSTSSSTTSSTTTTSSTATSSVTTTTVPQ